MASERRPFTFHETIFIWKLYQTNYTHSGYRFGCSCVYNVYTGDMTTKTMMKATVNIRTDVSIKREAQRVFKRMGLDLSTGVNMYLSRVAQDKAMPFTPRTVNGFTPEYEARILRETTYAEKYGKRYSTVEEALKAVS